MLQEQRGEDAEERGTVDTALFYTARDVKGLGHAAFILNSCLHVTVE